MARTVGAAASAGLFPRPRGSVFFGKKRCFGFRLRGGAADGAIAANAVLEVAGHLRQQPREFALAPSAVRRTDAIGCTRLAGLTGTAGARPPRGALL